MPLLTPIPTIYKGYKFRSRLEARWAVFFDSLKIPWVYEPEGVMVDGEKYLPDFYLPDCKQFFEVKGVLNTKDEKKIEALIQNGYSVTVGYDDGEFQACDRWSEKEFSLSQAHDSWLCRCKKCGKYWFMGSLGSYGCQCCDYYDGDSGFTVIAEPGWDTKAWDVARQARFEHGETPRI